MSKKTRARESRANLVAHQAQPFYESLFVPVELTDTLRAHKGAQVMRYALECGVLVSWSIGKKGTHISSKFETADGTLDYLTSPDPLDKNYESLIHVHVLRLRHVLDMAESA